MRVREARLMYEFIGNTNISFDEFCSGAVEQGIAIEDDPEFPESKIEFLPGVHQSPESVLFRMQEQVDDVSEMIVVFRTKPLDKHDDPKAAYHLSAGLTNRNALAMLEEAKFDVISDWRDSILGLEKG